ncbi:S-layer homology domain-containing protein [Lutispora sp.]|uniref:S-layer homology domain-containing protein n=1 Tax=Lutispora sp. TaxID=2828727 RepID=UPI002B1F5663|nr:S-layer homology domain-containing protein [Lutispora sp.]MEA4961601.1 S-layer homology domain-containing protein [Lutispora sp.]
MYNYYRDIIIHSSSCVTPVMEYVPMVDPYYYKTGTSMAAPHVSGITALLLSKNPDLTLAQVNAAIMNTVKPLKSLEGETVTGGMADAFAASAKDGSKNKNIESFNKKIKVGIKLDSKDVDKYGRNKLGVYRFDEKAKGWDYAGGRNDKFEPDEYITRAELVRMLVKVLMQTPDRNIKLSDAASVSFKDVSIIGEGHLYIGAAVQEGITTGLEDGTFRSQKPISREEMAAMIARMMNIKSELDVSEMPFKDKEQISALGCQRCCRSI